MKNAGFLGILFILVIQVMLPTCKHKEDTQVIEVASTVVGTRCDNGKESVFTADSEEEFPKFARHHLKRMQEIDDKYPGPKAPLTGRVKEVLAGDKIRLMDGGLLLLAGVVCPRTDDQDRNKRYFGKFLHSESQFSEYAIHAQILVEMCLAQPPEVVIISHQQVASVEDGELVRISVAYVWVREYDDNVEVLLNLNEALLINGLGVADSTLDHPYARRYKELEWLARKEKLGFWGE